MPRAEFSPAFLANLLAAAQGSPRGRQHHNVHGDPSDPLQRLFNAVCCDSYIRPHRHSCTGNPELLLAVRGRFALVTFDEAGSVAAALAFGTGPGDHAGVELGPDEWHTVVALEPSILFEVKKGPYRPSSAKEMAPWSPAEGAEDAPAYLAGLRDQALRILAAERNLE